MLHKRLSFAAIILFICLTSCGGNKTGSVATTPDSVKAEESASSPAPASSGSNIDVAITGGDMNGKYSGICNGCCSYGIAGKNVFGTQYSENGKGAKELSSVQLIVDSVTGSKSTNNFTLTVSFGKLFSADGKSFNINTREGKTAGSGTLDLNYSGDKATVTIKGTSQEGPGIDLKLTCDKVATLDNTGN